MNERQPVPGVYGPFPWAESGPGAVHPNTARLLEWTAGADECNHAAALASIPAVDVSDEDLGKMTSGEVRKRFPRFGGTCPDCNQQVIVYHSFLHYIAGDW